MSQLEIKQQQEYQELAAFSSIGLKSSAKESDNSENGTGVVDGEVVKPRQDLWNVWVKKALLSKR
jgi:hypothetical protein